MFLWGGPVSSWGVQEFLCGVWVFLCSGPVFLCGVPVFLWGGQDVLIVSDEAPLSILLDVFKMCPFFGCRKHNSTHTARHSGDGGCGNHIKAHQAVSKNSQCKICCVGT